VEIVFVPHLLEPHLHPKFGEFIFRFRFFYLRIQQLQHQPNPSMSIEMPSQSSAPGSSLDKQTSKSSKKDKPLYGEKKRKRDDDSQKSKSKKHKADKTETQSSTVDIIPIKSQNSKSEQSRAESPEVSQAENPKPKKKKQKSASQSSTHELENDHVPKPKKSRKPKISSSHVAEEISPFHLQTASLYLGLAPVSQKAPLEGLCAEHISPLILQYYPPFEGVLLSYSNPRLSEHPFGDDGPETLLVNIDEYAVSWAWLTAEFLIFKPERGAWLEGYVNLQNEGHLGVVCWNLFNASIERKRLPKDWKWVGVEDEVAGEGDDQVYAENGIGYWVDGDGNKVDGMVKFRVKNIEKSHDRERGFLSIEGTMLDKELEKDMVYSEKQDAPATDKLGRRLGGPRAPGATTLGVPRELDPMVADKRKLHLARLASVYK
jgi:DNA-directed RNA polymerase I subunit RPA43